MEGARAIGPTLGAPTVSAVWHVEGSLVDRAFVDDRHRHAIALGPYSTWRGHTETILRPQFSDALAAAALARFYGVEPEAVEAGLRASAPPPPSRRRARCRPDVDRRLEGNERPRCPCLLAGLPSRSAIWIVGGDPKAAGISRNSLPGRADFCVAWL